MTFNQTSPAPLVRQATKLSPTLNLLRNKIQNDIADEVADALKCNETNDIVIVLDSSGSIGTANYYILKEFVANLSSILGNSDSRQGFVYYSTFSYILYNFENDLNSDEKQTVIMEHPYQAGLSYTHLGINEAMHMLLKEKEIRPTVPKVQSIYAFF
jgi:hypothetical protein